MRKPKLTRTRIILAFAAAVVADLIQLPITAVEGTGAFLIPGEIADLVVDCFAMAATTALLGFHWALLPSLILEVIPELDLLPTWTGCVAFVIWQRKKEERAHRPAGRDVPPALPDRRNPTPPPRERVGEMYGTGRQDQGSGPPPTTHGDTDSR